MKSKQRSQHELSKLTSRDINLGLNGLEQAHVLCQQGDLTKALQLSELSLEILIKFLKSDPKILPMVSRDVVASRVSVALTEAEDMKRRVKASTFNNSIPEPSPPSSSTPPSQAVRSTIESLSNIISSLNLRRRESNNNAVSSFQQTTGQSTASPPKKKSNVTTQTVQTARSPSNSPTKKIDNNDPLVKVVKSDLYVDPSQLQNVSWDDIAGLEIPKQSLQEAAVLPLVRPDLFTGLRRPQNILLYGPPGTGKTMLVKAVAKESECLLFNCTASSLTSKYLGEGEKLVRTLFQVARAAAPSIIFIDEIDALLSARKSEGEHEASRRFKTEFMTQMDGVVQGDASPADGKHLLVISCTNCPWDVDSAVLRRFPKRIYIPLPDKETRKALLKSLLNKAGKHDLHSSDRREIVRRTEGFSCADMKAIASEASFSPLRSLGGPKQIREAKEEDIRPITLQDFEHAIDQSTKSVTSDLLRKYELWRKQSQQAI
jgi:SpoVK/Ycf46/Vps4 family AAA+-type ATPase